MDLTQPGLLHYVGSKDGLLRLLVEEGYDRRFDPEDYVGVVPRQLSPAITQVSDLATIVPLDPRTNPALAEQIVVVTGTETG